MKPTKKQAIRISITMWKWLATNAAANSEARKKYAKLFLAQIKELK